MTNPPGPVILVNPGQVDFGTAGTSTQIDVINSGTGTLIWSVDEDISWLTVTPATGTTSTDIDQLTLTADHRIVNGSHFYELGQSLEQITADPGTHIQ